MRAEKPRREDARAGGNTSRRQEGRNDQPKASCRRERFPPKADSERSGTFRRTAETRAGAGIEAGVLPNGKTEAESARGRRTRPRAPWGGTSRAARQRREVSHDLDNDGLSLVVLSSGVQEGRPFFFSVHSGPNPPRAGELDAETRRGIPATGDATR